MTTKIAMHMNNLSVEEKQYFIESLPSHLATRSRSTELHRLLNDYDFIEAKALSMGPGALINDYQIAQSIFGASHDNIYVDNLKAIQDAVRLSWPAIADVNEPNQQLRMQLYGRLVGFREPGVKILLNDIAEHKTGDNKPWLRLLSPSLPGPGEPLIIRFGTSETRSIDEYPVCITPDCTRVVSGSKDGTIKVWELNGGKEIMSLSRHDYGFVIFHGAIAIRGDGSQVAFVAPHGSYKVWDLKTGEVLMAIEKPVDWTVESIAITPDCTRVVSGSKDGTIKVWKLNGGKEIMSLKGHKKAVNSVAITPDGTRVVSGSKDGSIKVWDAVSCKELKTLRPHGRLAERQVLSVAITPDGTRVVSGSKDGTIKVWKLEVWKDLKIMRAGINAILNIMRNRPSEDLIFTKAGQHVPRYSYNRDLLAITPDGAQLVTGLRDGAIIVWDLKTARKIAVLNETVGKNCSIAITPDGTHLVTASESEISVWNIADLGNESETTKSFAYRRISTNWHHKAVESIAITPDGTRVVSGSKDGTIKVWDAVSCKELKSIESYNGEVSHVAITPDGARGVFVYYNTLEVWDIDSTASARRDTGLVAKAIGEDDNLSVLVRHYKTIKMGDRYNPQTRMYSESTSEVTAIAITPDGTHLVTGLRDGAIIVWDLKTAGKVANFSSEHEYAWDQSQRMGGAIDSLVITPNGNRVLSASYPDKKLKIWDIVSGRELYSLDNPNTVDTISVSPDGTMAIAGMYEKTKIWDIVSGRELLVIESPGRGAENSAIMNFAANARTPFIASTTTAQDQISDCIRVVSGTTNGTVRIWQLKTGETITEFKNDENVGCVAVRDTKIAAGDGRGKVLLFSLEEK